MATSIGNLAVAITANAGPLGAALKDAGGKVKHFAGGVGGMIGGVGAALGPVGVAIGTMLGRLGGDLISGAIGLVGTLIGKFFELGETIDAMSKQAATFDMPMEDIMGLAHAADLSGLSLEDMTAGLARMGKSINGPIDEALYKLADRIAEADPGEVGQIASEAFGKSWAKWVPMLKDGREGLQGAIGEAKELGIALNSFDGQRLEAANDSLTRVGAIFKGFWQQIIIAMAPAVQFIGDQLQGVAPLVVSFAQTTARVVTALVEDLMQLFDVLGEVIGVYLIEPAKEFFAAWFEGSEELITVESVVRGALYGLATAGAYVFDTIKLAIGAFMTHLGMAAIAVGQFMRMFTKMPDWLLLFLGAGTGTGAAMVANKYAMSGMADEVEKIGAAAGAAGVKMAASFGESAAFIDDVFSMLDDPSKREKVKPPKKEPPKAMELAYQATAADLFGSAAAYSAEVAFKTPQINAQEARQKQQLEEQRLANVKLQAAVDELVKLNNKRDEAEDYVDI